MIMLEVFYLKIGLSDGRKINYISNKKLQILSNYKINKKYVFNKLIKKILTLVRIGKIVSLLKQK